MEENDRLRTELQHKIQELEKHVSPLLLYVTYFPGELIVQFNEVILPLLVIFWCFASIYISENPVEIQD